MTEINGLIKYFMTIFSGMIVAIFLSQECLLQPNIINI